MAAKALGSIIALMTATQVFRGPTWNSWRALLKAMFALPLTEDELELYRQLTGRQKVPAAPCREVWLLVGRRGGKSIMAAIAVYQVTCRRYTLAPGEVGTLMVLAADRSQARVVRGYIGALLRSIGALEALIEDDLVERIDLKNGLRVEVHTASFRSLRGYTVTRMLERYTHPTVARKVDALESFPASMGRIWAERPGIWSTNCWWTARGSNSRPPHCERGALPAELAAHYLRLAAHRRRAPPMHNPEL